MANLERIQANNAELRDAIVMAENLPEAGGVNADWSVNDPDADGYIKNRPFYSYTPPSIVWTKEMEITETIDASALGLGTFIKISDEYLGEEWRARHGTVDYCAQLWVNSTATSLGEHTVVLDTTLFHDSSIGWLKSAEYYGGEYAVFVLSAYTAVDLTAVYGINIPSAGLYFFSTPMEYTESLEFTKWEIVKKPPSKFYSNRLVLDNFAIPDVGSKITQNLFDEPWQQEEFERSFSTRTLTGESFTLSVDNLSFSFSVPMTVGANTFAEGSYVDARGFVHPNNTSVDVYYFRIDTHDWVLSCYRRQLALT